MPKESGESGGDLPLFGRRKRNEPAVQNASDVTNLDRAREVRKARLTKQALAMKRILDEVMTEPQWKLLESQSVLMAIAHHRGRFHPGVPDYELIDRMTDDEGKIRATGPLLYYALIEALEERKLISKLEK